MRLGECLGLDFPDCELVKGRGMVNVRRQWTRMKELKPPKANSRRAVPISDELVRLLLEWKMVAPDKSGSRCSLRRRLAWGITDLLDMTTDSKFAVVDREGEYYCAWCGETQTA